MTVHILLKLQKNKHEEKDLKKYRGKKEKFKKENNYIILSSEAMQIRREACKIFKVLKDH